MERRNSFHSLYRYMTTVKPTISEEYSNIEYDAEAETLRYELIAHFERPRTITRDFGKEVCSPIHEKIKKSTKRIYKQVKSGTQADSIAAFRQVIRDVEELISIVSEEPVYAKYLCVLNALLEIRDFTLQLNPLPSEHYAAVVHAPVEELPLRFHYKVTEKGRINATITRSKLADLFDGLKDELALIAQDTSFEEFRAVFSGKPVTTRVRWMGVNSQLRAFISAIESKVLPPNVQGSAIKWGIAASCFDNRQGKRLTAKQLSSVGMKVADVPRRGEIVELVSKKLT